MREEADKATRCARKAMRRVRKGRGATHGRDGGDVTGQHVGGAT
jgi:hypothetical protein